MTEPPSLMTVNLPWNLRMKPSASISTSALRMASSCTSKDPRPAALGSNRLFFRRRTKL